MLPDNELREMRNALESVMPSYCNLGTLTYSVDGAGNTTSTFGTQTANVKCRLDAMDTREQVAGGGVQVYNRYKLTIPYYESLTSGMQVEVDGTKYNVIGNIFGNWYTCKRFVVEKID